MNHDAGKTQYRCDLHILTLLSISSVTSKTFIASKVFIFRKSGWFCLKAHNLPLFHAKFRHAGSSGLSSTCFWNLMKFEQNLLKKRHFWAILYVWTLINFEHHELEWPNKSCIVNNWHLICIILAFHHSIRILVLKYSCCYLKPAQTSKIKRKTQIFHIDFNDLVFFYRDT